MKTDPKKILIDRLRGTTKLMQQEMRILYNAFDKNKFEVNDISFFISSIEDDCKDLKRLLNIYKKQ